MKILSTKQIKELDAYTIKNEPIASIDLMERACHAFVHWFTQHVDPDKPVGIVCGTGNNGGDGLGIARILNEWNYDVEVWIIRGLVPESEDFKVNLQRLAEGIKVNDILTDEKSELLAGKKVVIDAIFGSGLSRPAEGIYEYAISEVNAASAIRIAVDIPSGLMADKTSDGPIVHAHYTITFQLPKLAFMLPQSYPYSGEWSVVDIGLSREYIKQADTDNYFVRSKDVRSIKRSRNKFDHKGNYGKALLISGSYGKMGAAVLGARAAVRSGLGLLTVHVPKSGYHIVQTSVPEAMASIDESIEFFSSMPDNLTQFDALGIGPGIGVEALTAEALEKVLSKFNKPVVLDADALNILATNREMLHLIPRGSILTPHPKEFQRLTMPVEDDFDRLELLRKFSAETNSIIVLKGAHTAISIPGGKVFFNSTGNPGLAKGGSGDVLTGLVTGLLAQGYTSEQAAILGVFWHGRAADLAVRKLGMDSMAASDVIEHLAAVSWGN